MVSGPGPLWSERRRPGPVRVVVDRALRDSELVGLRAVWAELARDAADLVDSARRLQDARLWATATDRLTGLLARAVPGDGGDAPVGRGGVGAGAGEGFTADLEPELGAGPGLRDGEAP